MSKFIGKTTRSCIKMKFPIWLDVLLTLVCTAQLYMSVNGLFCYRCLNLDCPHEEKECQSIRRFVQSELRSFYYFEDDLVPCPPLNEPNDWMLLRVDDECPEMKPKEAKCTSGRMQIHIKSSDQFLNAKEHQIDGTVLGCAKRELTKRIDEMFAMGQCDFIQRNQSKEGVVRQLEISHCGETSSMCNEENFCVSRKNSVVTPGRNDINDNIQFGFFSIIGVLGVIGVVILAVLIIRLCKDDGCVRSKLSKPNDIETKVVKVSKAEGKSDKPVEDCGRLSGGFSCSGTSPEKPVYTPCHSYSVPDTRHQEQEDKRQDCQYRRSTHARNTFF